jgi:hypothetical protein
MRNYDLMLILIGLFVLRVIVFSAGYADALCLLAILAYKFGKEYVVLKKVTNDIEEKIKQQESINNIRLTQLADEIVKVRNSSDGLRAAINLTAKK